VGPQVGHTSLGGTYRWLLGWATFDRHPDRDQAKLRGRGDVYLDAVIAEQNPPGQADQLRLAAPAVERIAGYVV